MPQNSPPEVWSNFFSVLLCKLFISDSALQGRLWWTSPSVYFFKDFRISALNCFYPIGCALHHLKNQFTIFCEPPSELRVCSLSYWFSKLHPWTYFFFLFFVHITGHVIPQPRTEPMAPVVAAQSLSCWTTRVSPALDTFNTRTFGAENASPTPANTVTKNHKSNFYGQAEGRNSSLESCIDAPKIELNCLHSRLVLMKLKLGVSGWKKSVLLTLLNRKHELVHTVNDVRLQCLRLKY